MTKSGIARIRELYPDQDDYAKQIQTKANWPLIVRRNPMGVIRRPGVAWTGEDKELKVPLYGPRYTAFVEDLYGIRAGAICLASSKSLTDGLTKMLGDEFAAISLAKKVSGACKPAIVASIIQEMTGRGDLYPPALIRAGIALASEKELDRNMITRVLERVA